MVARKPLISGCYNLFAQVRIRFHEKITNIVIFTVFWPSIYARVFWIMWKNGVMKVFTLGIILNSLNFDHFQKSILRLFCHIDHGCKGYPLWIPKCVNPKFDIFTSSDRKKRGNNYIAILDDFFWTIFGAFHHQGRRFYGFKKWDFWSFWWSKMKNVI